MNDEELNKKIQSKLKMKIAISNFEKEEKPMNKKKILKMVATFAIIIGLTASVTYAGIVIYEKIFKEPEKIDNYINELKVDEKDLSKISSPPITSPVVTST